MVDEVQVGLGRLGSSFWAFDATEPYDEDAVPDIVVLGKGLGNGFPIACVVCTEEVARALDAEGREVFSTFGGNPAACAAGEAVLDAILGRDLMSNAANVGAYLKAKLIEMCLMDPTDAVREVRGAGLFLGVELKSGETAAIVARRLRDVHHVLASTDGQFHQVIIIKPPMVWTNDDADAFVAALRECLGHAGGTQLI